MKKYPRGFESLVVGSYERKNRHSDTLRSSIRPTSLKSRPPSSCSLATVAAHRQDQAKPIPLKQRFVGETFTCSSPASGRLSAFNPFTFASPIARVHQSLHDHVTTRWRTLFVAHALRLCQQKGRLLPVSPNLHLAYISHFPRGLHHRQITRYTFASPVASPFEVAQYILSGLGWRVLTWALARSARQPPQVVYLHITQYRLHHGRYPDAPVQRRAGQGLHCAWLAVVPRRD